MKFDIFLKKCQNVELNERGLYGSEQAYNRGVIPFVARASDIGDLSTPSHLPFHLSTPSPQRDPPHPPTILG